MTRSETPPAPKDIDVSDTNFDGDLPSADPVEAFEAMAEEFRRDTGFMHPGKDAPAAQG